MYLLDTNIFLEILLQREKSKAAKHMLTTIPSTDLFMTDFSLHSIGVFLFQRNRQDTYERFVKDIILRTSIGIIGLDPEDVFLLTKASKQFNLDFDYAYQYAVAENHGLQITSFDADVDRTEKGRKVPGQKAKEHPKLANHGMTLRTKSVSNHTSPAIAYILKGLLPEHHGIYNTESAKRSQIRSIPEMASSAANG